MLETTLPALLIWNMWYVTQEPNVSRAAISNAVFNSITMRGQEEEPPATSSKYRPITSTDSKHVYSSDTESHVSDRDEQTRLRELEDDLNRTIFEKHEAEENWKTRERELTEELRFLESKERQLAEQIKRYNVTEKEYKEKIQKLTKELETNKEESLKPILKEVQPTISDEITKAGLSDMSVSSLGCESLECVKKIQELVQSGLNLKKYINELEIKERAYMETLQQADELWSEMENSYKAHIEKAEDSEASLKEKIKKLEDSETKLQQTYKYKEENYLLMERIQNFEQNEKEFKERIQVLESEKNNLLKERTQLRDALMMTQTELQKTKELVEGPLKEDILKERKLSKMLQEEIKTMEKEMEEASAVHDTNVSGLKAQMTKMSHELVDMECTNSELKEEVETLEKSVCLKPCDKDCTCPNAQVTLTEIPANVREADLFESTAVTDISKPEVTVVVDFKITEKDQINIDAEFNLAKEQIKIPHISSAIASDVPISESELKPAKEKEIVDILYEKVPTTAPPTVHLESVLTPEKQVEASSVPISEPSSTEERDIPEISCVKVPFIPISEGDSIEPIYKSEELMPSTEDDGGLSVEVSTVAKLKAVDLDSTSCKESDKDIKESVIIKTGKSSEPEEDKTGITTPIEVSTVAKLKTVDLDSTSCKESDRDIKECVITKTGKSSEPEEVKTESILRVSELDKKSPFSSKEEVKLVAVSSLEKETPSFVTGVETDEFKEKVSELSPFPIPKTETSPEVPLHESTLRKFPPLNELCPYNCTCISKDLREDISFQYSESEYSRITAEDFPFGETGECILEPPTEPKLFTEEELKTAFDEPVWEDVIVGSKEHLFQDEYPTQELYTSAGEPYEISPKQELIEQPSEPCSSGESNLKEDTAIILVKEEIKETELMTGIEGDMLENVCFSEESKKGEDMTQEFISDTCNIELDEDLSSSPMTTGVKAPFFTEKEPILAGEIIETLSTQQDSGIEPVKEITIKEAVLDKIATTGKISDSSQEPGLTEETAKDSSAEVLELLDEIIEKTFDKPTAKTPEELKKDLSAEKVMTDESELPVTKIEVPEETSEYMPTEISKTSPSEVLCEKIDEEEKQLSIIEVSENLVEDIPVKTSEELEMEIQAEEIIKKEEHELTAPLHEQPDNLLPSTETEKEESHEETDTEKREEFPVEVCEELDRDLPVVALEEQCQKLPIEEGSEETGKELSSKEAVEKEEEEPSFKVTKGLEDELTVEEPDLTVIECHEVPEGEFQEKSLEVPIVEKIELKTEEAKDELREFISEYEFCPLEREGICVCPTLLAEKKIDVEIKPEIVEVFSIEELALRDKTEEVGVLEGTTEEIITPIEVTLTEKDIDIATLEEQGEPVVEEVKLELIETEVILPEVVLMPDALLVTEEIDKMEIGKEDILLIPEKKIVFAIEKTEPEEEPLGEHKEISPEAMVIPFVEDVLETALSITKEIKKETTGETVVVAEELAEIPGDIIPHISSEEIVGPVIKDAVENAILFKAEITPEEIVKTLEVSQISEVAMPVSEEIEKIAIGKEEEIEVVKDIFEIEEIMPKEELLEERKEDIEETSEIVVITVVEDVLDSAMNLTEEIKQEPITEIRGTEVLIEELVEVPTDVPPEIIVGPVIKDVVESALSFQAEEIIKPLEISQSTEEKFCPIDPTFTCTCPFIAKKQFETELELAEKKIPAEEKEYEAGELAVEVTAEAETVLEEITEPVAEEIAEPVAEETAEPIAEEIAEPVAEEIAEPIAEEIAEPVAEEIAEPVVEEIAEPVAEEIAELVAEEIAEPIAEEIAEPVAEVIAEPVAEEIAEPVAEEIAEQIAEEIAEPVAEEIAEPVAEEITEPVAEEIAEPIAEEIAEPIAEEIAEPAVEEIAEPVAEEIAEPIVEEIAEPVAEEIAEPVAEEIAEQIAEEKAQPAAEEIAEPIAEPVAEEIAEPVAEEIAEPVAEEIAEPIAEEIAEPIAEEIAEPAVEEITEPVAEEIAEPIVEEIAEPIAEEITEPVAEEIAEQIAEEKAQPAAEEIAEPVAEEIAEPVAEEITEPVAEEIAEPGAEEIVEPAAEEIAEPVAEEKAEQVADEIAEPVAEEIAEPVAEEIAEPVAEEIAEPVAEEIAEPVAEEIAEPVEEEIYEPAAEEVTEPAIEEIAEPVAEEIAEPVAEEIAEPVAEEIAEPVAEEIAEPIVEEITEPVAEEIAGPVAEEIAGPVAEEIAGPIAEEIAEPVTEEVAEPVVEEVAEPVAEEIVEPIVEEITEPVAEEIAEPVAEEIAEPVAEEIAEPVAEEIAEPVAEEIAEPVTEEIAEPVAEVITEPAAEVTVELAAQEIAEPVVEEISEPVAEERAEPFAEEISEPVAEEISEPVAEEISELVAEEISEPVAEEISEPVAEERVELVAEPVVEEKAEPVAEKIVEPVAEEIPEPVAIETAEIEVAEPVIEEVVAAEPVVEIAELEVAETELIEEVVSEPKVEIVEAEQIIEVISEPKIEIAEPVIEAVTEPEVETAEAEPVERIIEQEPKVEEVEAGPVLEEITETKVEILEVRPEVETEVVPEAMVTEEVQPVEEAPIQPGE
ncbi:hypothetical protein L9F63_024166 [Diploptera punctata]|uniref:PUM-HD domain-containing protein n=1 Tax=Diploptera punctata TaxID=6984 RepID=A0AAD7ZHA8_DIPPU|nr:hypothetical protein L9F63_024166 [Diploptera punctata]